MTNTKHDIPREQGIDVEDTDLDLPELSDGWEWRHANRSSGPFKKVNVFFGKDVHTPGGWVGEIDNYEDDGREVWDVHVRGIHHEPGWGESETLPDESADTCNQFDTLDDAIESVPDHIETHYE